MGGIDPGGEFQVGGIDLCCEDTLNWMEGLASALTMMNCSRCLAVVIFLWLRMIAIYGMLIKSLVEFFLLGWDNCFVL